MTHFITWFEIPVTDFARAQKFYSDIFMINIDKTEMGEYLMGFFPGEQESVSGSLVQGKGYVPAENGVLVYLNGGDDLNFVLSKVTEAGGRIAVPKTLIREDIGYFAVFNDTEGNKTALHSMK
jgi:uncharacterized protein